MNWVDINTKRPNKGQVVRVKGKEIGSGRVVVDTAQYCGGIYFVCMWHRMDVFLWKPWPPASDKQVKSLKIIEVIWKLKQLILMMLRLAK